VEISARQALRVGLPFDKNSGVFLHMDLTSIDEVSRNNLELDYEWDYKSDPIITPTIIHEWDFLDVLMSKEVTAAATNVLSIGGGGNSRTHIYLTEATKDLFVLNPGIWDLQNYPSEFQGVAITKIQGIAEDLPFKDASIDAIEIPSTLDHVLNPSRVLLEAFRILRPKGKIGITLGNQDSWYRATVNFLRIDFNDNHTHAHNFHFAPKDVEALLSQSGFTNVKTIGTAYLKLPRFLEIWLDSDRRLSSHRFLSNGILKHFFSRYRGGMFLVVGQKPTSPSKN
jgi:SAM-dependent methyltransferase